MSRIGNRKISIPEDVTVTIDNGVITVKGPKGELSNNFDTRLEVAIEDNAVVVKTDKKELNSMQGTTNAIIKNMVIGVKEGYKVELETVGVGYRFSTSGNKITVNAGYSNPVEVELPKGITAECPSNTELILHGNNKQELNEFAANVRKIREPEPYKGKGIRFKGEYVRRKVGKKAA